MLNPTINLHRVSRWPSGWIAAGLLAVCAATAGCSNIQSQASNVEGVRLYQQGNYQQASDRFQQAIAQDPKSPEGYYNLAASLQKIGTLYNRPERLEAGRDSLQPMPGARSESRRGATAAWPCCSMKRAGSRKRFGY